MTTALMQADLAGLPSLWMDQRTLSRFVAMIAIAENGCWEKTGFIRPDGYGYLKVGSKNIYAHVAAYTQWVGPVPPGMQVDHVCHTRNPCALGWGCRHRRCLRPDHLEAVSASENTRRGRGPIVAAGRELAKTHCVRGHPYNESNTYTYEAPRRKRRCRTCNRDRERQLRLTGSRTLPTPERPSR